MIASLVGLLAPPSIAPAAVIDGSAPILCALTSVVECPRGGDCTRSTPDVTNVPGLLRVNVEQRVLSTADGTRTSPIAGSHRSNGRLMLQGMQNERVWGAVIEEETGRMSATVGEDDGAFVISGACIVP